MTDNATKIAVTGIAATDLLISSPWRPLASIRRCPIKPSGGTAHKTQILVLGHDPENACPRT